MDTKFDEKDKQLISLLRQNARTPVVTLAKALNVSRATVQNRLDRLEQHGIILGYTVKLKPEIELDPIRLLMNISLEAKDEPQVIKKLHAYPQVIVIHHTSGHWDLIAEIRTDTLSSLNKLLGEIRLIHGIIKTETNLLLDSTF
ncbi:Lrp/AsnC family transcriptional regulator [Pseudoalteromonas sp. SSM20]|uniref:Lrp/AsnC family transcriptional regulator n=1 Tax=unclassified Pseudoalteromonas TaxID=194690 RepID=UPI003565F1AC